ncbi:PTS mannose/fructose/sorbose transporter subunit IIC [Oenococcus kitaharae]|uniref:PTS system mannose-specific IIC component n=1 Tax=Oenococcus kitaharae DSM 17330 TaxID=1045004 RepID=G9WHX3_9LACO|nr:PTS mannose/fructose/sorbose transporter subunit IIC [Oenococcus kitaharae]EHN58858.1 PTS system mannose-specific IIC component [Oenococcus kitaharae DSM 17330]MCV3296840.1 PTS mannose/fructose/sorbose transporter subunit IIC [Oenococcus kitaharae]OEY81810.1 PTS mannose transporter subunit IIC [Oenococcus kitaharae]OEY84041.1 PTS mannose transporter subunit IIC [Oenococcus kitaharae]OEY85601.1 PTS mannose transporter subunit IIC [Oenococcus kitaharae]
MNIIQGILVLLVAGIAGVGSVLDEGQTHRPLVACTLVGLILGNLNMGIILGGTLEMMALGWMNVGLAMAPDTALASIVSTLLVINTHANIGEGIAIAVPLAAAGQALTIFVRTIVVFFVHKGDDFAKKGNYRAIEWMHVISMGLQALRVMVPTAIVMMISTSAVEAGLKAIPTVITGGLQIAGGIIVVVGYAMVINMMDVPHLKPFFYLGFLFAAFTNFNLVGFGGLGLIFALLYIQLKYNNNNGNNHHSSGTSEKLATASASNGDDDLDDDLDD